MSKQPRVGVHATGATKTVVSASSQFSLDVSVHARDASRPEYVGKEVEERKEETGNKVLGREGQEGRREGGARGEERGRERERSNGGLIIKEKKGVKFKGKEKVSI